MAKILKAILITAYCALIIQFINTITRTREGPNIELNYIFRTSDSIKRHLRELRRHGGNLTAMISAKYKRPQRLHTDLKYILKYTNAFAHYTSSVFHNGQGIFIESNCSYINCFLTNDKTLLQDIRNFDAILFDVENVWDRYPILRSPYQKYIFTAAESSDNYPICEDYFDQLFNWTWSYRLDSDIRWTYLTIVDVNNKVVGPSINMNWVKEMGPFPEGLRKHFTKKKKAAAWFISNCNAKSKRKDIAASIKNYLNKYGHTVDVFGMCGSKICPRERMSDCLEILGEEYYFYFAFENSISEDYVTEKVLHALKHYTVPVVYGGANYSRFLPPGSYIDARNLGPEEVSSLMMEAIVNTKVYENYFRWHNHYIYREISEKSDICNLCKLINEKGDVYSTVKNFRKWWNSDYKEICRKGLNVVQ